MLRENKDGKEQGINDEGFIQVQNRKIRNEGNNGGNKIIEQSDLGKNNKGKENHNRLEIPKQHRNKNEYRKKQTVEVNDKHIEKEMEAEKGKNDKHIEKEKVSEKGKNVRNIENVKRNTGTQSKMDVGQEKVSTSCSNRYTLLDSLVDKEDLSPPTIDRDKVDQFLYKKNVPTDKELQLWTPEIHRYYKDKKKLSKAMESMESEDVVGMMDSGNNTVLGNEVDGIGGNLLV